MITLVRGGKMISTIIRWVLTRVVALSLVVLGLTMMPNAASAQEVPVPAPTFVDRCGTAQDEAFIPTSDVAGYYRDVVNYDFPLRENHPHLSGGAAYVKIIAEYTAYDSSGAGYLKQEVFEYTFDTSSPNGCQQALDTGSVAVGVCDPSTGRTQITITFTNTRDATGIYPEWVELLAYGSSGIAVSIPVTRGRVLDGETVSWTGGYDSEYPIYPSHFVGEFMTFNPHRSLLKDVKFTVPACGQYPLVEPDDGGLAGGSSAKPTAKLKLVKCVTGRVQATLNNRKIGSLSRFKMVKAPMGGKSTSRTYKVKPRALKKIYVSGTNTVYKVFWKSKAKGWIKLDRLRAPSRSRCG